MVHFMKKIFGFMTDRRVWGSRFGVVFLFTFLAQAWFVFDWCVGTTFRPFGWPNLWINNLLAALLLSLPWLIFRKVWLQLVWQALIDLLLVANLMYCRTYFTGIPPGSYVLVSNVSEFTESIQDSLRWADLGFMVLLAAEGWLAWRKPRFPKIFSKKLWQIWSAWTGLLAVTATVIVMCWGGGFYRHYDKMVQYAYTSTCGVPTYTVAGHIAYSLLDDISSGTVEKMGWARRWLGVHEELMPHEGLPPQAGEPRKNLVIILCESLESWPIGLWVDGKEVTPYLNRLVADSTSFYADKVLTQVSTGRSIDGQLLITSGLLPTVNSVYSMKYAASSYPSLNKALKADRGARSILLNGDKGTVWNQNVIARSFGYDTILDRKDYEIDETMGRPPRISDGSFFRQSVAKLRDDRLWPEGEAAMVTLVTFSGHNPFKLLDKLRDPAFDLSGTGLPGKITDYLTMAHYTDSQLATLVDYLLSRTDAEETLIVITGDHEGLADYRREALRDEKAGAFVSPHQFTPFIVLNSPVPGYYDKVLGQVDIYSTLLDMLGLGDYCWQGAGQSVFARNKIPAAYSSMTGALTGDTAGVDARRMEHLRDAREASDVIIKMRLFDE